MWVIGRTRRGGNTDKDEGCFYALFSTKRSYGAKISSFTSILMLDLDSDHGIERISDPEVTVYIAIATRISSHI